MDCKNCRTELIGFSRGTLPKGLEIRIREHLNGCAECRSFAGYLHSMLDVIPIERNIAPDPFLATRIEGILSERTEVSPGMLMVRRMIPVLTFSLFILAGVAGGIGLGKMISSPGLTYQVARNEFAVMIDDLRQEPIETFFMGMNEPEKN
jgi:hypothetical protein